MRAAPRIFALLGLCFCVSFASARAEDGENPTKEKFDKGVALYDAGKLEEAYKIFESIDDENIAAMHNVALMRRKGEGTEKDPKGAEEMFEQAAMAGDPFSQAMLGEMLLNGEASPPDPKAAAGWLMLASYQHHPTAEFELGELFATGNGVPKNIEMARQLLTDAASRGVPGAKEQLASLPPPDPAAPSPPLQNPKPHP
jgi:TPR repeat protein